MNHLTKGLALAAALIASVGSTQLQAQDRYAVTGTVADSTGTLLERAMVVALALPDSALTAFATTNADGRFTLQRVPVGDYLLQVQISQFVTQRTPFQVVDQDVNLGATTMAILAYGMEPLVVSVDHVPFQNRRDTLIFNAAAFETRPNASVEDLLRRLPGFEVDADGGIEVQGEVVEKVLVEGREFFGSDPTIATRGLPADAIDRVEVFDKESDMAEFTGIPDGNEQMTLNLRLTQSAQRGYFGNVAGSLGASETSPAGLSLAQDDVRYDEQLRLNRFTSSTQLALIGSLNNVSRARFSSVAAAGGGGGRGDGGGGGGGGFTRSGSIGLNGSHQFTDDDWLRGSWFFSDLLREQETSRLQQQLLGSNIASTIANDGTTESDTQSHRINLDGQRQFSVGHQMRLRAGLNLSDQAQTQLTDRSTTNAAGMLVNTENSLFSTNQESLSGSANLTWMKRLDSSGRSLVFNAGANLSDPESQGNLASMIEVFGPNSASITDILQTRNQTGRNFTNTQRLALTQPFGSGRTLEVFAQRRDLREEERLSVFDLGSGSPILNPRLSSGLEQTYRYYAGGFRLNRNTEKSRVVIGLQAQRSRLEGTIDGRDDAIENGYTRVLPSADLRVQLSETQNVSFRYSTATREPSMEELQPFQDNTSPTNVYMGNPDLQPEYTHSVNGDWRYFDPFSFLNVFTYARLSRTGDDIVTSRTIDERGFQTLQPVNAGTSWSASGGINFGRPVRPLGINLSIDYSTSLTRRPEFVNGDENRARILGNTVSFQAQNRTKDRFDLSAVARFQLSDVEYSLNDDLDQSYMNSSYTLRGSMYVGDNWTVGGDWAWQRYDPDVFGDVENVALLNLSLSRFVMNEKGSIEISAVDLMNESQVVNFDTSPNSISESRTQALGRYLLIRFNYRLGNLGGRGRR